MAKRPKFSRWRRLPGVYRFCEQKAPDPNQELQRVSLYVPWEVIDAAEVQAGRLGYANAQDYCTDLLMKAVDDERVREQVAGVEAKRGALKGLNEISDDPDYLAEWRGTVSQPRPRPTAEPVVIARAVGTPDIQYPDEHDARPLPAVVTALSAQSPAASAPGPGPPAVSISGPEELSPSAWVVLRHSAQAQGDPMSFLPCLRRGEAVPPSEVAELAQALHSLESEYRGAPAMDRRLTFALHRLAFESQILHTDAWPNAFDPWTIDMLRAVQEAVERILSGQDIRYSSAPTPLGGLEHGGEFAS